MYEEQPDLILLDIRMPVMDGFEACKILKDNAEVPIAVHIGINSGVALVGPTKFEGARGARWTYTASGVMTNIAARIAALGEPGTVLVGPETARRIAGQFAMRELGIRQFKNISEAVIVCQILGMVAGQGGRL